MYVVKKLLSCVNFYILFKVLICQRFFRRTKMQKLNIVWLNQMYCFWQSNKSCSIQ